jgi:site-specific recombinase XerD
MYLYYYKKSPELINKDEIEDYILTKDARNTKAQNIGALRLFYEMVVNQPVKLNSIKTPRKEKHLPTILDRKAIIEKIEAIQNKKHRALLHLVYGCGLRRSEPLNMLITDIDSLRMMVRIADGKGGKDRYVPLPKTTLNYLREYFTEYKPKVYLFNGWKNEPKYNERSLEAICNKYLNTNPHTLRHSYATHLLEAGSDIEIIRQLLGHNSIKTTQIYLHVSKRHIGNVISPVDM